MYHTYHPRYYSLEKIHTIPLHQPAFRLLQLKNDGDVVIVRRNVLLQLLSATINDIDANRVVVSISMHLSPLSILFHIEKAW